MKRGGGTREGEGKDTEEMSSIIDLGIDRKLHTLLLK